MFQRRRDDRRNVGVYLLAYQLMSAGPIPPVTLSAILLQVAIFLGYVPVMGLKQTRSLCLLPARVISSGEWYRLLAPVLMHGDDMHLYYNMVSLLWKGHRLESRMGSFRFGTIVAIFSLASTLMTVAVSFFLDLVFDSEYMYQCAVGFSGRAGNQLFYMVCYFILWLVRRTFTLLAELGTRHQQVLYTAYIRLKTIDKLVNCKLVLSSKKYSPALFSIAAGLFFGST